VNGYAMGIIWDLNIVGINICHHWVSGMVIGWLHLGHWGLIIGWLDMGHWGLIIGWLDLLRFIDWYLIVIVRAGCRALVHVDHWLFPAVVLLVRHDWLPRDCRALGWFWLGLEL
jgi:hypothetical protein